MEALNEVYWIKGFHAEVSGEAFGRLMQMAGAREEWLDAVYWRADALGGMCPCPVPLFEWGAGPLSDHHLLQAAAWAILSGERHLLAVGTGDNHFALLASPQAVGRYNLMPEVRLTARCGGLADSRLELGVNIQRALQACSYAPEDIAVLGAQGFSTRGDFAAAFVNARTSAPASQNGLGAVGALNALAQDLMSHKTRLGLLVGARLPGIYLATLLERI